MHIRPLKPADWTDVAAIYAEAVSSGIATLDDAVPTWEQWDKAHLSEHRVVAAGREGALAGFGALRGSLTHPAFSGVAQVSVFVAAAMSGQGFASRLLGALVASSEEFGLWTLQTLVFPENQAARSLYSTFGFREVGSCDRLARVAGVFHDLLLLERRSTVVYPATPANPPEGEVPEAS